MDTTAFSFEIKTLRTVRPKSCSTVAVCSLERRNHQMTVFFAVASNDTKSSYFVILNSQPMRRVEKCYEKNVLGSVLCFS